MALEAAGCPGLCAAGLGFKKEKAPEVVSPGLLIERSVVPCYHPIDAWHSSRGVAFVETLDSNKIKLPCGRCIGCRLERSRQWALRLVHEKRFHEESAFITLTYDENNLPEGGSLEVKHFQDFMKRLRKRVGSAKLRVLS